MHKLILFTAVLATSAQAKVVPRLEVDASVFRETGTVLPRVAYGPPASEEEIARSAQPRRPIMRTVSEDDKRPETALEIARTLGVSGDDARPEQQFETTLFGKRLIVGGEIGASARLRRGYQLERGAQDDDLTIDPEAKLEAIWLPSESSAAFVSTKVFAETTPWREGGSAKATAGAELQEFWLLKTGLFNSPLAIQIGRQQIQDRREWWWDQDLDAVRLHWFGKKVTAYAGVGREFGHKSTLGTLDPEDRRILRVFGNVKWDWADRQQVEFYGLHANDHSRREAIGHIVASDLIDESDARLSWLGLRARGRVKTKFPGKFYYWGDIALVTGRERLAEFDGFDDDRQIVTGVSQRSVRGWAFDAGASFELPFKFSPYLTLGYALGSGDKSGGTGSDGAFRQTGLHGNNGKFRGLSRFRYYGEVLRPDLSNIKISTVALGVPIGESAWIETIWHNYRQVVAQDRISGSRLDIDPDGVSRKLGDEFDLVASYRPLGTRWEFEFTAGAFRAGPAFGPQQGRWAGLAEFKLDYNF